MAFYVYPQYSTSAVAHPQQQPQHYRHHHRGCPSYFGSGYQTSPAQVQDALDIVSALVDELSTADIAPKSRFSLNENGQFKFAFDIQDYKPEELKIDVEGRDLIVCGNHKSEDEHGILEKQFSRRFTIPENIDLDTIKCDFDEKHRALEIYGKRHEIKDSEKKSIKIGIKPMEVEDANKSDKATKQK